MWNWQKIRGSKNLPPFKKNVLLYQKKEDGTEYVTVGALKSIDADGNHWGLNNSIVDIFAFFGTPTQSDFQPTHWCQIERPKVEVKTGLIKFEQLKCGMYVKVVFLDDENDNIKTEETGTVEVIGSNDDKAKTFILRHDQRTHSVRLMTEWLEIHKLR